MHIYTVTRNDYQPWKIISSEVGVYLQISISSFLKLKLLQFN